jgi:hypothetical protein
MSSLLKRWESWPMPTLKPSGVSPRTIRRWSTSFFVVILKLFSWASTVPTLCPYSSMSIASSVVSSFCFLAFARAFWSRPYSAICGV